MLATLIILSLTPAAEPSDWTVMSAEGSVTLRGTPILTDDFSVTVANSTIHGQDLVQFRRSGSARPAWPRDGQVILANGDRIPGTIESGDTQSVVLSNPVLTKIRIPLTTIASVWFVRPAGTADDPMLSDWLTDRKTDVILLRNRDTVRGTIERISADGRTLIVRETGRPAKAHPIDTVSAVGFASGLSRVKTPNERHGLIVLADGTRLTASSVKTIEDTTSVETAAGFTARFPTRELHSLTVKNGRSIFLTDLKPLKNETTPQLTVSWPLRLNRSAKGNPLRLAGPFGTETFDSGLGLHAKTVVEYELAKRFSRFDAQVGLDAVTGRLGRVVFTIQVDQSKHTTELTSETGPILISREIRRADRLILSVSPGSAGDQQADLNIGDAFLVK